MKILHVKDNKVFDITLGEKPEDTEDISYVSVPLDTYVDIDWGYSNGKIIKPNSPPLENSILPLSPEPLPELPNLTGLRDEISYGSRYPLVQDWYDGLPPRQRDPLQMAIANQELGDIEYCLLSILPTDEATLKQLKALLIEFKVPINL